MTQQTTQKPPAARTARQVFAIAQRNGKSYWIRIGAAFINQDGSETVLLDALPVTGRMQIRSATENGKSSEPGAD
jgi:hypothetical protein